MLAKALGRCVRQARQAVEVEESAFVLDEALEGGVNESLNLDSHGKSWSSLILSLEIELPTR